MKWCGMYIVDCTFEPWFGYPNGEFHLICFLNNIARASATDVNYNSFWDTHRCRYIFLRFPDGHHCTTVVERMIQHIGQLGAQHSN